MASCISGYKPLNPISTEPYLPVGNPVTGDNSCLTLYFAKKIYPLSSSKKDQADHQREINHCYVFWHGSERLHAYDGYQKVRDTFKPPRHWTCDAFITLASKVTVQFSIIESKNFKLDAHCINLLYICGNLYNSQSTIGSIYPHLRAYQKLLKTNELPALRIFSWGPNDIFNTSGRQYLPNFKEAGAITHYVLKLLKLRCKGPIYPRGHSLGATYLAESLPLFKTFPQDVPAVMCLDRGFTTFENAAWNVGYLAYASYPIAAQSGFYSGTAALLKGFFSTADKSKPLPKITLLSALEDHRMYGAADYCNSLALQRLATNNQIRLLRIQPSHQELTHEVAVHSYPIHKIQKEHCITKMGPDYFKPGESFADAFLREMLEARSERKESPRTTRSLSFSTASSSTDT